MVWSKVAWLAALLVACGGESRDRSEDRDESGFGGGGRVADPDPEKGGSAGDGAAPVADTTELIDDGDRADENLPLPPNTSGFWWGGTHLGNWFVNSPAPNAYQRDALRSRITPPRDESVWAFHVQDAGRESGVDLWAQLDHPMGRAVDLRSYTGFSFWARLSGPNQVLVVGMNPGVAYFAASAEVPTVELSVTSEWQRFELDFEQFGIDGGAVASFDFIAGQGGGDFDLWIDDLALRCRSACNPSD